MRVAFIPTEVSGVNFYRVWQPAEAMRKMGHRVAVLWYTSNLFLRENWELDMGRADCQDEIVSDIHHACEWGDVVVWMGLHGTNSLNLFKNMRQRYPNKPFVMEMDDNIFLLPSYNIASSELAPGSANIQIYLEQMGLSDAMIVSTPTLKEAYKKYFKKPIHVVENSVDLNLWRGTTSPTRQRLNIGWVGGASHSEDIEMVGGVIHTILKKYPKVTFTFLHGVPESLKHKEGCRYMDSSDPTYLEYFKAKRCPLCKGIDRVKWTHDFASIKDYPRWVKKYKFDIGIAPLIDNDFNRSKSNLRYLEYSAMGIPTVASPLPHFKQIVKHGENGFLAQSQNEWMNCLSALIESDYLRRTIGNNAKNTVRKEWNPKVMGRKCLHILKEITHAVNDKGNFNHSGRGANRRPEQPALDSITSSR